MPSAVGAVNVASNSGQLNFGDVLNLSPKDTAKVFKGSGTDATGNIVNEVNVFSATNTWNICGVDQPMIGNA